jgi:hypothetical protein
MCSGSRQPARRRNTFYEGTIARSRDRAAGHDRTETGCPYGDNHPFRLRICERPNRSGRYVQRFGATAFG